MRTHKKTVALVLSAVLLTAWLKDPHVQVWASGIAFAIIPQAVPVANRQGTTGTKFQIATGNAGVTGNCIQYDANGNAVDSGVSCSGGSGSVTLTVATGTKALATGAISSATCTAAQTATATGALTSDKLTASFSADPTAVTGYIPLTAGMLTIIPYLTADTMNFKVCNNTTASITPGAITLNWSVLR